MNTLPTNGRPSTSNRRDSHDSGEDTLRLIASLPAPNGLAERMKAGMQTAPESGRILMWRDATWRNAIKPAGGWMYSGVARGAAAAAIVCVVAGGGWRIYSRVQPGPSGNVLVMPSQAVRSGGGFGSANATRVPDTLDRPVLTHSLAPTSEVNLVQKTLVQPKAVPHRAAPRKKAPSGPAVAPVH